jgi:hypothetical protein
MHPGHQQQHQLHQWQDEQPSLNASHIDMSFHLDDSNAALAAGQCCIAVGRRPLLVPSHCGAAYGIDYDAQPLQQQQQQQQQHRDPAPPQIVLPNTPRITTHVSQESQGASQPPPPPTLENAFHVSVAPITQPLDSAPPADVVLIISIGPILFREPEAQTSQPLFSSE